MPFAALDAALAAFAVGAALAVRPWRMVYGTGPPWVWVVAWATLPVLWCLDRQLGVALPPPLSGAALLVLLTMGAVTVAAVAIRRLLRPVMARLRWALVGLVVVATCVAVREISFHYTDMMLSRGPHAGWLLELAGVACVAVAARRSVLDSTCRI